MELRCRVEAAAKVNGNGPTCALCYHLSMARAVCDLRGVTLVVQMRRARRPAPRKRRQA
jgi:hypothetical protein